MDNDVVDLMVLFVELVKVVDVLMIPASQLSPAFISDLLQSKPFHDYHDFGEFFNTLIPSIVQNVNFRFSKDSHGMDNSSKVESTLDKKHNSVAYHYVRNTVAASIITVAWIKSTDNLADALTKRLQEVNRNHLFGNWMY